MNETQILELMDKLESQNGDDASWCWMELRRLLEENAAQQKREGGRAFGPMPSNSQNGLSHGPSLLAEYTARRLR